MPWISIFLRDLCLNPFGDKRGMVTPLRIGVWFDANHFPYGGPTVVILNTILGFLLDAEASGRPVVLLLNEPGDVNWNNGSLTNRVCSAVTGPVSPLIGESDMKRESHVLAPTEWVRQCILHKLPSSPRISLWPAGVDTEYYSPGVGKTQDFFIYYKSQRHTDLHKIHEMLFTRYFHLRGHVLAYYCYTPEMLRQAARSSRFCIVLNNTETQGLAMLEIMSCDCPLFVVDCTTYRDTTQGASSAPCWDAACGKKASWGHLHEEFAAFLSNLPSYRPRLFVESGYSLPVAAASLRSLLSGDR